jgi:hypothetical protein
MAAFMRGRKWGARKGLAPPLSPVQGREVGGAALLDEPGVFSETVKPGRLGVLPVTGPKVRNLMSTGTGPTLVNSLLPTPRENMMKQFIFSLIHAFKLYV